MRVGTPCVPGWGMARWPMPFGICCPWRCGSGNTGCCSVSDLVDECTSPPLLPLSDSFRPHTKESLTGSVATRFSALALLCMPVSMWIQSTFIAKHG